MPPEGPSVHLNKPSINKSYAALSGIGKQWLEELFPHSTTEK
jgi:hypothetical protein